MSKGAGVLVIGDAPGGVYLGEVLKRCQMMPGGNVASVHVYHDDDCGIWRGLFCDCAPTVQIKRVRGDPHYRPRKR